MPFNKVFIYLTYALALFPLLKLNHFSILMMIWLLLSLISGFKRQTFSYLKEEWKTLVVLSFFAWMYWLYLPFATDYNELGKSVVKSLPFIVFPIGFILNKDLITSQVLKVFGSLFLLTMVILNILGWISVFSYGFFQAWKENDFYHPMFRTLFTEATSLHLPYLGLLSSFAALWAIFRMFQNQKVNLFHILAVLYLIGSVYIYSARMALVCFFVGVVFMIWKMISKPLLKWGFLVVIPLGFLILFWFSPVKERYTQTVEKEWVLPHKGQQPHEVNYRYGVWHCAVGLIKKHPVTGVGADKVQQKLDECYNQFDYESYEDFTQVVYNTHNQYFDQILKFGIFGFIVFCLVLFRFFPNNFLLYQVFVLIVSVSFLTENLLDRQIGVVFISLFNTIFVISTNKRNEKNINC